MTNKSFLSSVDASPGCSSAGAQSASDEYVKTTEIPDHADDHTEYEHSDTTDHADTVTFKLSERVRKSSASKGEDLLQEIDSIAS